MNVKLVSADRKVSKLCEVEPGTFPEYGTWDEMPDIEDFDEEWEIDAGKPFRWIEFTPRGMDLPTTIFTSGDIWLQDDHGGTLERVR